MPDPNVKLIPEESFSFTVENGGRTWARMLTPIIAENGKDPNTINLDPDDPFPGDPAEGHGYHYARTYSDKCYGLVRGLTGWQAGRPWSNFFVNWQYSGEWIFVYDEYGSYWLGPNGEQENLPYDYYDNGSIYVGFYAPAGFPTSIHWFDQEEIEEVLTGAVLETSAGTRSFTTDWLKKYYDTQDQSLVLYATGVSYTGNHYPLLGITGANI